MSRKGREAAPALFASTLKSRGCCAALSRHKAAPTRPWTAPQMLDICPSSGVQSNRASFQKLSKTVALKRTAPGFRCVRRPSVLPAPARP
ncbi:hypothetical protein CQW32_27765 [Pseudomonas putida]|nr:hypothetical protein CQW32_27765 [Pseudomonas putida]